jgi:hypothetical protein
MLLVNQYHIEIKQFNNDYLKSQQYSHLTIQPYNNITILNISYIYLSLKN